MTSPFKSFLDGLKLPDRCLLICHDQNHNGDIHVGKGCGNPECWKHVPGNSPEPKPMRQPTCRCPIGTFNDILVTAYLVVKATGAVYQIAEYWTRSHEDDFEQFESVEFFWGEGNYACDCNRALAINHRFNTRLPVVCSTEENIGLIRLDVVFRPNHSKSRKYDPAI